MKFNTRTYISAIAVLALLGFSSIAEAQDTGLVAGDSYYILEQDGSTTCDSESRIEVEETIDKVSDLGITVLSAFKGRVTGNVSCMACFCPSGVFNVVETADILEEDQVPESLLIMNYDAVYPIEEIIAY